MYFNITMWHEIFKMMFSAILVFIAFMLALRVFAGITYKLAHKKVKRNSVNKAKQVNTEIEYNIRDKDKKYLFEIKREKKQMRKGLRECLNY